MLAVLLQVVGRRDRRRVPAVCVPAQSGQSAARDSGVDQTGCPASQFGVAEKGSEEVSGDPTMGDHDDSVIATMPGGDIFERFNEAPGRVDGAVA